MSGPRGALVLLAALWPAACDDADTVIALYSPGPAPALPIDEGGAGTDAGEPAEALPDAFYLEAESGALSGPFSIEASDAASAGAFIVASEPAASDTEPGAARAVYDFTLARAGHFVIWGRIHSPDALSNRYWVRVDGGEWILWRISTGEAWYWDDVHDNTSYGVALTYALDAGEHRLELANAVIGAELDRLYITARNDHPPGNTTPCNPPHSIELGGACRRSCGSYGDVSCLPEICAGLPELDAYDCPVCCQLP